MNHAIAAPAGAAVSSPDLATRLGRVVFFCLASVPFGIARALREEPLRSRPTEASETFWIVPEINFGPLPPAAQS